MNEVKIEASEPVIGVKPERNLSSHCDVAQSIVAGRNDKVPVRRCTVG
jgi:hypothetical protein